MLHPDTVLRTVDEVTGVGVFATRPIPRGTITWVRDPLDLALPDAAVAAMHPLQRAIIDRYAWQEDGHWILCWDQARYVNHACTATCVGLGVQFEIAVRDIAAGEQLTDDYRSLGVFEDPFDCLCGTPDCTGRVEPGVPRAVSDRWHRDFAGALTHVGGVPQPLMHWVSMADLERIGLARDGPRTVPDPAPGPRARTAS